MQISPGTLRKFLLGISFEKTTFARPGFSPDDSLAHEHFRCIIRAFLHGYHAVLEDDRFEVLLPSLEIVNAEYLGFAFEGAALALTCIDFFSPWKRRFQTFLEGPGVNHTYALHIGAGWTLKWLPHNLTRFMSQFDPLLAWLVVDGYGFSQGFSSWHHYLHKQARPPRLSGYALRVFDQGLGRSLWFVKGADPYQIITTIQAFPLSRQGDLWSGVGVACAYAGGVGSDSLHVLQEAAGREQPHLAQGAIFAAMARKQAGNRVAYTDLACEIISGTSSDEAIHLARKSVQGLPQNALAYEIWRSRVRGELIERGGIVQPVVVE
jgi:enediyne biosynthesis protein E3